MRDDKDKTQQKPFKQPLDKENQKGRTSTSSTTGAGTSKQQKDIGSQWDKTSDKTDKGGF